MTGRRLWLGSLILGVMLVAVWQHYQTTGSRPAALVLFPELSAHLAGLSSIQVQSQADKVTLLRQEDGWVVAERDHYRADFSKINSLAEALAKARLVERKTAKPANHAILGLAGLSTQTSHARRVSGVSGDFEFSILVGNKSDLREANFVRRESEDQVWLTDVVLDPDSEAQMWLDATIINVEESLILEVEFFSAQGESTLRAFKAEAAENWQLAGAHEGLPLKYSTIVNALGRALTNVRLVDVAVHDPVRWKDKRAVTFGLAEQRVVAVSVADIQEQYWLRVEDSDGLPDQARWDYRVERYVFDEFAKTAEDFLQEADELEQD